MTCQVTQLHVHGAVHVCLYTATLQVDATSELLDLSHEYAYFCDGSAQKRTCNSGWDFNGALEAMEKNPRLFSIKGSCVESDLRALGLTSRNAQLEEACQNAVRKCPDDDAEFTCKSFNLAEGIWQIQLWIRQFGAVSTRLQITKGFKEFFEANRTGVYNSTLYPKPQSDEFYYHAVTLIGPSVIDAN